MNVRAGVWVACVVLGAWLPMGCGGKRDTPPPSHRQTPVGPADSGVDAGTDAGDDGGIDGGTDAGTDAGDDAGTDAGEDGGIDAGSDAGTDGGTDAGSDAGTDGGLSGPGYDEPAPATVTELPAKDGFRLFSLTHPDGSPVTVNGITADEGGNIWVAAGTDGLFLLRAGAMTWEQLTMKDGLHPYGYMPDGSDAPGPHYLEVLSVAGGSAGSVFVGYRGRPVGDLDDPCQSSWTAEGTGDPSLYKSGDADRVTLTGDTAQPLSVVHYDIFSGPGMVVDEMKGREKVCSIYSILYDRNRSNVWFGGNHGFAVGDPNFEGSAATHCFGDSYGNYSCSGVYEHIHPAGVACGGGPCTYRYYGFGASPLDGSLWVGGWIRSLHYDFGSHGGGFFTYMDHQFDPSWQFDVWPDSNTHAGSVHGWDDQVTSVAVMGDGSAWYGSWGWGLAHIAPDGTIGYVTRHDGLHDDHVTALVRDTYNGESLWIGGNYDGLSRLRNGQFSYFDSASLGLDPYAPVSGLQIDNSQSPRRVLVSFRPGVLGIYAGN